MSGKESPTLESVRQELQRLVFDLPGFVRCTLRLKSPTQDGHRKVAMRPVTTGEGAFTQFTLTGGLSASTANLGRRKARDRLDELLADLEEAHLSTDTLDFHARVTRKGHVLVSRGKRDNSGSSNNRATGGCVKHSPGKGAVAVGVAVGHDREKDHPLTRFDSMPLMRAIGFADSQDRVMPSMMGKYRQVNEFIRALDAMIPESRNGGDKPFSIVDAGCGKAYLSIAAVEYLRKHRSINARLCGVDIRPDVIASCKAAAERLGYTQDECEFTVADIASYAPPSAPDVTLSLHACDNATDEAIACGAEWGARYILSVPCCQHEIQKTLPGDGPNRALLRHGILRERLSDLLADAFRAQILRILGYRVKVAEFVEQEATSRNIMIRAERGVRAGADLAVSEYLDMRDFWRVTPYLETRLGKTLSPMLARE